MSETMTDAEPIAQEAVKQAVKRMPCTEGTAAAGAVLLFDQIGSTNTFAREVIVNGRLPLINDGRIVVIAADAQVAGRGRLDHTWVSQPGESFTVSFAIAVPRTVASDATVNGWLQMIAGLSTLDALCAVVCTDGDDARQTHRDSASFDGVCGGEENQIAEGVCACTASESDALQLKWPNDIFCDGKKLGGILAEMVTLPNDPQSVAIVFGIGLNLCVPADRLPTAQSTSLQLHYQLPGTFDDLRDAIAARIAQSLRARIAGFCDNPHRCAVSLREETQSVCWTLGHEVEAHFTDGSTLRGKALALNEDASLTMQTADGNTHVVRTADVGVLVS
ncbi:biotin-(acetyl-CoA carboxylase) ligase [Bifidobacterium hapali]|uniref:Biotin-(Acetyl-CoA carboxylase) ligase n=2 Tax=Bifidobacterium hapali TaxID=1630172 RepID=A0A261FXU5_9BIFI|nr:biotin--[acetyl-CoA-carboxylase] ligase [Bifidobacterium hapali]OZG63763.1 biotin-(acetyl-CoA carboxylase) ligase [Bifidobacterium hapali]